jgi:hypothetical protein
MNWIDATIKFPSDPVERIGDLVARYGVSSEGEHFIDGVKVELSYAQRSGVAFTVEKDNFPLTRFRLVSVGISLPVEKTDDGEFILRCCWPETLISALQSGPKPEWLDGIELVDTET